MDDKKQIDKIAALLRNVLELMGENPDRDGLQRTPERWAEALLTCTSGMKDNADEYLNITFPIDEDTLMSRDDMIIVSNIHFVSTCEHHIAPFQGVAHVGYIPCPDKRTVTGLSKLARVVKLFARRLQIQEKMTGQIASAIDEFLEPLGVIVVVKAIHYCMIQRGVEQQSSFTLTTAKRGVFLDTPALEQKFQGYISNHLA